MPQLDAILEHLGPPPPEICLDWAWQLQLLVGEDLQRQLGWHEVRLSADHQLDIQQTSNLDSVQHESTAADLIQQLIDWSGCANEPVDVALDAPQRLALATRSLVEPNVGQTPAERSSNDAHGIEPSPLKSNGVRSRVPSPDRGGLGRQRTSSRRSRSPLALLARHWMLASAGGLSLVSLLASMAWWSISPGPTPTASAPAAQSNATPEQSFAPKEPRRSSPLDEPRVSDRHAPFILSQSTDDREGGGVLAEPSPTVNALEQTANRLELPDSPTSIDVLDQSVKAAIEPKMAGGTTVDNMEGTELPARLDVLRELKKLVAGSNVDDEASEQLPTETSSLPIRIRTFPPHSISRFKENKALSVRQPEWQLRLEVPDELTVTPSEPQTLTGRESIAWRVELVDGKPPITALHVVAQLANARSTDIRWSVFAMGDDLPQGVLPVGREILDRLQSHLGQMNQQLNLTIENLRLQGRAPGFPYGVRGELSRQRRDLERELEIGQRLLQVVADANQMSGLLDSELAVHARLEDARQPNSTGLLQFGITDLPLPDSTSSDKPANIE